LQVSFVQAPCCEAKSVSLRKRFRPEIAMRDADYYADAHHEAASKFVGQRYFAAKYLAGDRSGICLDGE
jgi:hypothetical protein